MEDLHPEWGPFGVPLFDAPEALALSRVGVIDIGSNSVRLVVFDGAARSPAYYFNEKILCGLGAGFSETGRLNPEGRVRALKALRRFAALASGMGVSPLLTVATAAVRDAEDGAEFRAEVLAETGLDIHVVDGGEEARLAAQGVLLGWPGAEGLVCDIGGSSMELAELRGGGKVGLRQTSDLGPLKLMGLKGGRKAVRAHIKARVADLAEAFPTKPERLFLVGGSWRAIARIDMERRGYPLKVLHEYRMTPKAILETIKLIEKAELAELKSGTGTSSERMRLVPWAAEVLKVLVRQLRPKEVAVSSYGIREGLLYEQMSEALRHRDPLIEAARHAEAYSARMPGFGRALYRFVEPLFPRARHDKKRLIRAACLLHDVSWRAHPDYRAEVCFDNATRANLGGMTHGERVYLGLALLHRYKSNRAGTNFNARLLELLPEAQVKEAEILGRAMRFGAMFTVARPGDHGALAWRPKRRELILKLKTDEGRALFGEVAEARFKALAGAMGAEALIVGAL
ncbi:Ppx/GppA family phosphatase [Roseibacterium sp. SDUM158017]|uniref:Ppx/GppA family phosphatase n=1 Tax=Roseicyclus salinarum TaxID=3036773 RepID=UPI002414EBB3|nr:Ppx/GppA family phosphatase [Roseibacterium sp. SDUM158017]MDG4650486.1 Ppx/GppA family phosphatase [Roseibacterium sp. SDUM158017]